MHISRYTIGIISPAFDSFLYWGHILENVETFVTDGYTYYSGSINGTRIVIIGCTMGAAALSLATLPPDLLSTITHLVYMGYAGAVNARLKVGDVIPATQMMTANASSIQGETGRDQKDNHLAILMNPKITNLLYRAAEQVVLESVTDPLINAEQESQFKLNAIPAIISGHVGDGDPFYISQKKIQHALKHNPNLICLEKEGMAVAMISEQYEIPSGMIHIIVQADNDRGQIDYAAFITDVADRYIAAITFKFINLLSEITSVSL